MDCHGAEVVESLDKLLGDYHLPAIKVRTRVMLVDRKSMTSAPFWTAAPELPNYSNNCGDLRVCRNRIEFVGSLGERDIHAGLVIAYAGPATGGCCRGMSERS